MTTGHDGPATPPVTERGRLAQIIATRGGLAPPEAPFVIEHREALIYMLCEAAELEHGIMCQYLFAAFTLKQNEGEGLTGEELAAARRWRSVISHVATQEMLHLALVQNLLSAVGAAPHLVRPNFPHPASHYPAGVHLALLPFGEQALRHFMFLERPEGMDLHDGDGLAAFGRAVPHMLASDIVPRGQDFATVGHMYRSIEAGFARLCAKYGEDWLFVGPERAQATQEYFGWPQLIPVTDLASAQRAIDEILEQGEGPRGHWENAHFGTFVEILDEFEAALAANRGLQPARPVLPVNVRPCDRDVDVPLADNPVTAKVMDLFNVAYEILLQILERFFAHTDETDAQLKTLADATMGLMFGAIKPLGDLITTLPVGPSYPGANAGPSFELFYESDYLLPHRHAAWALLTERLGVAADFCREIIAGKPGDGQPGADRQLTAALQPVGAALDGLARALSVHLPASDPRSYAAPDAPADPGALRASVDEYARARHAARLDTDAERGLADVFDRTLAIVTRLFGPASGGAASGGPASGGAASGGAASGGPASGDSGSGDAVPAWATPRLVASVLRPLADALSAPAPTLTTPPSDPHTPLTTQAPSTSAAPPSATQAPPSSANTPPATQAPPSSANTPPATQAPPTSPDPADTQASPASGAPSPAGQLWEATVAATTLYVQLAQAGGAPPGLPEAVAALQDLACAAAPAAGRASALRDLQASLPASIRTAHNGPYLVTNVPAIRTHLGQPLPAPPQLALCRCGGSARKPFCDGSHAGNGFSDAKDPNRVPDRRDTYDGEQVTVFDNRGICQHSGFCTDRLNTVFRAGQEPFVAPSGGRMDEIVRAVRDCPSGALSLAFDGHEERDLADGHNRREPAIEITADGPYRVTGRVALVAAGGGDVARAEGSSREHYALCRCGHSQNKPFCSGMHWYIGFTDPARVPGREPSLFEWAGGVGALTRLTRRLYEKLVPADTLLAPLFADIPPGYPQREAARIAAAFGGSPDEGAGNAAAASGGSPAGGAGNGSRPGGRGQQAAPEFTGEQRTRWITLAGQAADEAGLPADPEFRAALEAFFAWDARGALARGAGAPPDGIMPSWDWTQPARRTPLPPPPMSKPPMPPPPMPLPPMSARPGRGSRCPCPGRASR